MEDLDWVLLYQDSSIYRLMWKYLIIGIMILSLLAFIPKSKKELLKSDALISEVLEALGESSKEKQPKTGGDGYNAKIGKDLITMGFSKRENLKKAKRQSKHFVCTSCHNIKREDPDLAIIDPQARLDYVVKKGLPYLPATTLYGAVNRKTFYNGDYEKKYGVLVIPARNDLREAIQLCATECAQGRRLKGWEMESIVAYLNEIGLKVKDLNFTDSEVDIIQTALDENENNENAISLIHSKYADASPATFIRPPDDRKRGSGIKGDPDNGKLIYNQSCLHCHYQKRYSFLHLDNRKMAMKHLNKNIATYNKNSIYQVIRWGTFSKFGKKSYMPRFTKEKMSDQQLADLRAYIEQQAEVL